MGAFIVEALQKHVIMYLLNAYSNNLILKIYLLLDAAILAIRISRKTNNTLCAY